MRRDTSNLDRMSKSTSEQPVACFHAPPPPTTSPPNEENELDESRVMMDSQRTVPQVPRRLPTTTLIPSPVGIYFRRLPEEDRIALYETEGPILTIDSKETLTTPNDPSAPILLLRKASGSPNVNHWAWLFLGELKQAPLENRPTGKAKRTNISRHKHSHSFGGDSSVQIRTPKMTARVIVRQPSEPLYYQQTNRSKSRDDILAMQTPRVAIKREKTGQSGDESVKTTRSLKIVTYSVTTPELSEEKKASKPPPIKKAHKKSSSSKLFSGE